MILREWKYEDILRISELEKECFEEPWTYRMFADAFSSPHFVGVCAEEDEEIVGYACETVLFENAEIDNVAVAKEYRRKGLGRKLLEALEKRAAERGASVSVLEVRVSNAPAMLLYLREGYKGIYTRSRYYHDGEDAVVMQKTFG